MSNHCVVTALKSCPGPTADQVWQILLKAHDAYESEVSPHYDEVLHEVSDRVGGSGSIGKSDIGAILFWKRLRADTPWVRDLMVIPDLDVRHVTAKAVNLVRDEALSVPAAAAAGRSALGGLPGLTKGDALASALLTAAAPGRMAVYDRRAQSGLEALGMSLSAAPGRYSRYMEHVEALRAVAKDRDHAWAARDIDLALYWLGGSAR